MSSAREQIRIISLGEIVVPDFAKAIEAFTDLIKGKKQTADRNEIRQSISLVLKDNKELLDRFKTGLVNETEFTDQMIGGLEETTNVRLTVEEFNNAWNMLSPKFEQFKDLLQQAIEYNDQPKQKIIFNSYTNPKDMRSLRNELEVNKQTYRVVGDQLIEIGGIQIRTTYATQQTKAELIETIIKESNSRPSILASSMSNVISLGQAKEFELPDIKYIRGVNNIDDPILKEDLDQTNQEVEEKTKQFSVDTILWMKQEVTLADVLCDQQVASKQIYVAKL